MKLETFLYLGFGLLLFGLVLVDFSRAGLDLAGRRWHQIPSIA